jgi:hypothetical protein
MQVTKPVYTDGKINTEPVRIELNSWLDPKGGKAIISGGCIMSSQEAVQIEIGTEKLTVSARALIHAVLTCYPNTMEPKPIRFNH